MPVVVKYVVERNGTEKMTFSSKAEADAYDKLLETAEQLEQLLEACPQLSDNDIVPDLAMFLAENKDDVLAALNNKRKPVAKPKKATPTKAKQSSPSQTVMDDLVIEPDDEASSYLDDESVDYSSDDDLVVSVDEYTDHAA